MKKVVAWPKNLNVEMNAMLSQEASQGNILDSRLGTPGAKQHNNLN